MLYVPHAIVLTVWSLILAPTLAIVWLALLIEGRMPMWLHRFVAAYVRYTGQVTAWFFLLSARYPDPMHTEDHPFAIDVPERPRQPRVVTLLRPVLAIPPLLLATALRVVLTLAAIPAWFAGVALGRTTGGLHELGKFTLPTFCTPRAPSSSCASALAAKNPALRAMTAIWFISIVSVVVQAPSPNWF